MTIGGGQEKNVTLWTKNFYGKYCYSLLLDILLLGTPWIKVLVVRLWYHCIFSAQSSVGWRSNDLKAFTIMFLSYLLPVFDKMDTNLKLKSENILVRCFHLVFFVAAKRIESFETTEALVTTESARGRRSRMVCQVKRAGVVPQLTSYTGVSTAL